MKINILGNNFKTARKKVFPKDTLQTFAIRLGISRATLQKMEKGDLSVSMAHYYKAAELLSLKGGFEQLFVLRDRLFDD